MRLVGTCTIGNTEIAAVTWRPAPGPVPVPAAAAAAARRTPAPVQPATQQTRLRTWRIFSPRSARRRPRSAARQGSRQTLAARSQPHVLIGRTDLRSGGPTEMRQRLPAGIISASPGRLWSGGEPGDITRPAGGRGSGRGLAERELTLAGSALPSGTTALRAEPSRPARRVRRRP